MAGRTISGKLGVKPGDSETLAASAAMRDQAVKNGATLTEALSQVKVHNAALYAKADEATARDRIRAAHAEAGTAERPRSAVLGAAAAARFAKAGEQKAAEEARPTHTMSEAKRLAKYHQEQGGQALYSARYARAQAQTATAEAEKFTGDAKAAKLAEAAQHEAKAKAYLAEVKPHLAEGAKFTKMVKEGNVLTAAHVAPGAVGRAGYAEHREARIERLGERADQKRAEGNAALARARQMADVIPFGQPIHVGHHSEQRDRNFREKIHDTFGKGYGAHREADRLEARAEAAAKNHAISSDDQNALTRIHEKIAGLERHQRLAVEGNKVIRAAKGDREKAIAGLKAIGHDEQSAHRATRDHWYKPGQMEGFNTTSGSAEMRRLKERADDLIARAARPASEAKAIGSVKIHEADNRVKFAFPGKPSKAVIGELKSSGFRWAPSEGVWQRNAGSTATYHAERIAKMHAGG